jgi:AcrR family transcriptional regulator
MSTSVKQKAVRRPGGRTADVTGRVHGAVFEIMLDGGLEACTFSNVAERAGVERSTLYRRYPDRMDMIIDTWMARGEAELMPNVGDSFAEDLRSLLRKIADLLETPIGPALLTFAAELRKRSGTDYSRTFFDRRMAHFGPMFDAAVERGELARNVDRETLFSFAAGPMYFRMFIAGRPLDDAFIDTIVASVCWLYCSPSAAAKLSLPARIA